MKSLVCRECGAQVASDASECPGCGCRTPFACTTCRKPLSAVSLGQAANLKHPHGSFSEAGEPLCHAHRLTRCHHCERVFPHEEMKRHVVGKHADRVLREGKPPRIEPVFGYFCNSCESGATSSSAPELEGHRTVVLGLALLVTAVLLAAFMLR